MKKYYLHNGKKQIGPFNISELKGKGIKLETEIWFEGIVDWTKAGDIDELKSLFLQSNPPPIKKKTKNSIIKYLTYILIAFSILLIILILNKSQVFNSNSKTKTSYQKQKLTIGQTEKSNPLMFLSIDTKYNENFWGDKFKLRGKVTNRATVANYKDLVVRITYYSKTKTVIGTKDYTIYEVFPPNNITPFKLKVTNYDNVKSIGLKIIRAIPY